MTNGLKITEDRIAQLQSRLAASLKPDGTPALGLTVRVQELRAEIARLETARALTTQEPAGLHPLSGEYGDHLG